MQQSFISTATREPVEKHCRAWAGISRPRRYRTAASRLRRFSDPHLVRRPEDRFPGTRARTLAIRLRTIVETVRPEPGGATRAFGHLDRVSLVLPELRYECRALFDAVGCTADVSSVSHLIIPPHKQKRGPIPPATASDGTRDLMAGSKPVFGSGRRMRGCSGGAVHRRLPLLPDRKLGDMAREVRLNPGIYARP
jgi:hypothetical protein